jgi:hypothetical protein
MSYFNEPARLAILNMQKNMSMNVDEKPSENKGLLSRTNPMSMKSSNGNKTEIDKVIEYTRKIKTEMEKYKDGI